MATTNVSANANAGGGGCGGCLGFILFIILILMWGLFFGVTVDGKHHELDCSCDDGVQVISTEGSAP